ncbi:MAG: TonB-dependent receptor family protein [Betaproteobacteria bacterium]
MKPRYVAAAGMALAVSGAYAQSDGPPLPTLDTVVVTATRSERLGLDVPASVNVITREEIRDSQLRINLSESLTRVPGVVALNRENYAQDLQISIRGFGARSTFGVRGIRLHLDGVPATQPDGQGQVSNFPLNAAQRIEVLRGPFSALYGNSSGGVIALTTQLDAGPWTPTAGIAVGSFDTWRAVASLTGGGDGYALAIDGSAFATDGYREHSAATRDVLNAAVRLDGGASGQWRINLNALDMPDAQDPLGLTRAQWQADPPQANPLALTFNTRKSTRQNQIGLQWNKDFDATWSATASAWIGRRSVQQFQAIPVTTQAAASSPGGVIDFDRDYGGADGRVQGNFGSWNLVAGLAWEWLDESRQGYNNFITAGGQTTLGVQGALRRDENNRVASLDPYLQAEWQIDPQWRLLAGGRASNVSFDPTDKFLANGDDSGANTFRSVNPTVGVVYRFAAASSVYAAYGRGFETPTLNEIAYRPDGSAGLNTQIQPATSNNFEVGLKAALGAGAAATLALFSIDTTDDIIVLTNAGGRSSFGNVGATSRRGTEVSLDWRLAPQWSFYAAATSLLAQFDEAFLTCTAAPCRHPSAPVAAGNRLPGVPAYSGYAALRYLPGWADWTLEWCAQSQLYVDDRNTQAAPGYGVVNLAVARSFVFGPTTVRGFVRATNLLDKGYVGAVIVNEANGRYYEPAPGRAWLVGLDISL